jgi:hypothetical protein
MEAILDIHPVDVFDGNQGEVLLVKSPLDNAEIESFLTRAVLSTCGRLRSNFLSVQWQAR